MIKVWWLGFGRSHPFGGYRCDLFGKLAYITLRLGVIEVRYITPHGLRIVARPVQTNEAPTPSDAGASGTNRDESDATSRGE